MDGALCPTKAHQGKCVEKHCIIEADMLKSQEFFDCCNDAAVHNGKCKSVVESKKKAKQDTKTKKEVRHKNQDNFSG